MRFALREWSIRLGMVALSTLFALVLAEGLARVLAPISDGRDNVDLQGRPIKSWFDPGTVYRQLSNEYDALTTITDKGHRVPGVDGNPDVIFIGDSFTYGWGLSDDEAFASIYCRERRRACVNLGRPGTGTARQIDRLEQFLSRYDWHPAEVKLFFFGMSGSFSAGNDFVDNYFEGRGAQSVAAAEPGAGSPAPPARAPAPEEAPSIGFAERIIGWQSFLLGRSNLLRQAKYHWGPLLKSLVVADPGEQRMAEARHYTQESLKRLHELSLRAGFTYTIYLLVPVQDIIRGTYADTQATLDGLSPKPVIATASLFTDSPQAYYYAYDGHLNARGNRRIAELLISLDRDVTALR